MQDPLFILEFGQAVIAPDKMQFSAKKYQYFSSPQKHLVVSLSTLQYKFLWKHNKVISLIIKQGNKGITYPCPVPLQKIM